MLILPILGIVAMAALFMLLVALWPVVIILVALSLVLFRKSLTAPFKPREGL
ncbi:MAG: hypothetical protein M3536_05505 [Actinomycetota bacterium]|nr:hypothetical protein [Actinomycetota bacterium]